MFSVLNLHVTVLAHHLSILLIPPYNGVPSNRQGGLPLHPSFLTYKVEVQQFDIYSTGLAEE